MYLYDNLFTTSIAIVDVLTNVVSVASLIGVQILRTFGILLHLLECRKFLTLHVHSLIYVISCLCLCDWPGDSSILIIFLTL